MTGGAGYDAVLVAHVASAVVGFGAVATTGAYCGAARRSSPRLSESVRRYFAPGVNLPARLVWAVPLLGVALVGMSGGDFGFGQAWLAASLGLWVAAALVAQAVVWPGERDIQWRLARRSDEEGTGAGTTELTRALRRVWWGAAAVDLLALAALALMLAKPGGPS